MRTNDVSRGLEAGNHHAMKKWRYAILGWIVLKVVKRKMRRKLPFVDR